MSKSRDTSFKELKEAAKILSDIKRRKHSLFLYSDCFFEFLPKDKRKKSELIITGKPSQKLEISDHISRPWHDLIINIFNLVSRIYLIDVVLVVHNDFCFKKIILENSYIEGKIIGNELIFKKTKLTSDHFSLLKGKIDNLVFNKCQIEEINPFKFLYDNIFYKRMHFDDIVEIQIKSAKCPSHINISHSKIKYINFSKFGNELFELYLKKIPFITEYCLLEIGFEDFKTNFFNSEGFKRGDFKDFKFEDFKFEILEYRQPSYKYGVKNFRTNLEVQNACLSSIFNHNHYNKIEIDSDEENLQNLFEDFGF